MIRVIHFSLAAFSHGAPILNSLAYLPLTRVYRISTFTSNVLGPRGTERGPKGGRRRPFLFTYHAVYQGGATMEWSRRTSALSQPFPLPPRTSGRIIASTSSTSPDTWISHRRCSADFGFSFTPRRTQIFRRTRTVHIYPWR